MTLSEAIQRIDDLKSNAYTEAEKRKWLSGAEAMVAESLKRLGVEPEFSGFTADTPGDTALLAAEPYDELYLHWLSAQMDLYNGEYTRFNNSMALFTARLGDYENFCRRERLPLGRKLRLR